MTPLTRSTQRPFGLHQDQILPLPVAADTAVWTGALVATNAAGLAVPAADTAGLTVHGICRTGCDNRTGAVGTLGNATDFSTAQRYVRVDRQGEWALKVTGTAPKPGQLAFAVDDDTVSAAPTVNNIPAGRFTRPAGPSTWFVDVERR
jgi:hypothetical protein